MSKLSKKEARLVAKKTWKTLLGQLEMRETMVAQLRTFFQQLPMESRVLATFPLPDELDYFHLLKDFTFQIYIPRVVDATTMEFRLHMNAGKVVGTSELGFLDILGPSESSPLVDEPINEEDVVLVPGLASNSEGFRLGRGGGFYDRWKERLQTAWKVAVLPQSLIRLQFQAESHDLKLDRIITECGTVDYSHRTPT